MVIEDPSGKARVTLHEHTYTYPRICSLSRGLLEVGNDVGTVTGLLETVKGHLSSRNVLLGVLEILKEGLLVPGDALLDVSLGVGVALGLAGLAAKDTVQIGTDLVGTTSLNGVALGTTGLEELGALGGVSGGSAHDNVGWMGLRRIGKSKREVEKDEEEKKEREKGELRVATIPRERILGIKKVWGLVFGDIHESGKLIPR